jgi:hypothetical protein
LFLVENDKKQFAPWLCLFDDSRIYEWQAFIRSRHQNLGAVFIVSVFLLLLVAMVDQHRNVLSHGLAARRWFFFCFVATTFENRRKARNGIPVSLQLHVDLTEGEPGRYGVVLKVGRNSVSAIVLVEQQGALEAARGPQKVILVSCVGEALSWRFSLVLLRKHVSLPVGRAGKAADLGVEGGAFFG